MDRDQDKFLAFIAGEVLEEKANDIIEEVVVSAVVQGIGEQVGDQIGQEILSVGLEFFDSNSD